MTNFNVLLHNEAKCLVLGSQSQFFMIFFEVFKKMDQFCKGHELLS